MNSQDWENRTSLRRVSTSDYSFLESLYRIGREAELAMTPFTAQEKDLFIQQQFAAQTQHYHTHYCSDFFNIIDVDSQNAGRFFIDYWSNEIRIVDIALLPEFQNSGLGTYLMRKILKEGHAQDKPVTIHVEETNPARRLYERLGFKEKSRFNDVYILMECTT